MTSSRDIDIQDEVKRLPRPNLKIGLASSLTASTIVAAVFHPWDHALWLAKSNQRAFLLRENFVKPYQGFFQTITHKPIGNSLYFFAQGELNTRVYPYLLTHYKVDESIAKLIVGIATGIFYGTINNPLSAAKSYTWNNPNHTFFSSIRIMYQLGGFKPFLNGTKPTIIRDSIFGGVYEPLRNTLKKHSDNILPKGVVTNFICDAISAGTATMAGGAFDYARTIQYSTPPHQKAPSIAKSIGSLIEKTRNQPTLLTKITFFQKSLCLGWGTVRVAVGIGTGQSLADNVKKFLTP